jgi:hypothetical protein
MWTSPWRGEEPEGFAEGARLTSSLRERVSSTMRSPGLQGAVEDPPLQHVEDLVPQDFLLDQHR